MKTEKPVKKGFLALLRESFTKTGGCCGAGETCGASAKETDKAKQTQETGRSETKRDVTHG